VPEQATLPCCKVEPITPLATQVFPVISVNTKKPCLLFVADPQALGSIAKPVVAVIKQVAAFEKLAWLV
jgi:hypothetical protein